jgi:hypothetical protein
MLRINVRKTLLVAGGLMAIAVPAGALAAGEGQPVKGGARNPANDARKNYTRETEIIANVDTYGTRQSNKSDNGGGAIYGCRSKAGGSAQKNEPCIRAVNLNVGNAFEFQTGGVLGGLITVGRGGDGAKPFTTNATGVATGLNADRVDGREGSDLLGKTEKAADADKVDGIDGADLARAGDLLFAIVDSSGNVTASRGGEVDASGPTGDNTFTLTFPKDVSACSFTATQRGATAGDVSLSATTGGGRNVIVDQDGADAPAAFQVQVLC